jgi:hypothetical protein
MESQLLRRLGFATSSPSKSPSDPTTTLRSSMTRSQSVQQSRRRDGHLRPLRRPNEDVIGVRLCAIGVDESVIDDGTYTTLCSSYSFDDLMEVAQTCMGPHAACEAFTSMEITSLDLVEGDMSISEIQTQGPARRRINLNSEKSWREHIHAACLSVRYVLLLLPWLSTAAQVDRPRSLLTESMAMWIFRPTAPGKCVIAGYQ